MIINLSCVLLIRESRENFRALAEDLSNGPVIAIPNFRNYTGPFSISVGDGCTVLSQSGYARHRDITIESTRPSYQKVPMVFLSNNSDVFDEFNRANRVRNIYQATLMFILNSGVMRNAILLLLIFAGLQPELLAQEKTEPEKEYKNTIRFNLTNPLIFGGGSLIFGYERVLRSNQSFSVNVGRADFPSFEFRNADSLKANSAYGEKGFNFSVDYRFYLMRENKYNVPRGVYIGPYYSYNYFERSNSWSLKPTSGGNIENVASKTTMAVHTAGFEMGYQFIFWNRVSLDLVLAGPGLATYNLKTKFGTDLSEEDKEKFFEKLNQALSEKFPGYSRVIDDGEFERKGSTNTVRMGYRYMAMLGFRF